jgi:hypothetical protein
MDSNTAQPTSLSNPVPVAQTDTPVLPVEAVTTPPNPAPEVQQPTPQVNASMPEVISIPPPPAVPSPSVDDKEAVTPEEIEKMFKLLADAMLEGLEKGAIEVEASEESSAFVLERLDNVKTKAEMVTFLTDLANRWPIYNTVSMQYVSATTDRNNIENIQGLLHSFIK